MRRSSAAEPTRLWIDLAAIVAQTQRRLNAINKKDHQASPRPVVSKEKAGVILTDRLPE